MNKIPSTSVSKSLKSVSFQFNFKIKKLKKATKTYGGYYQYYGDLWIGRVKIGRIGEVEALNTDDLKRLIKNQILEILDKEFK